LVRGERTSARRTELGDLRPLAGRVEPRRVADSDGRVLSVVRFLQSCDDILIGGHYRETIVFVRETQRRRGLPPAVAPPDVSLFHCSESSVTLVSFATTARGPRWRAGPRD